MVLVVLKKVGVDVLVCQDVGEKLACIGSDPRCHRQNKTEYRIFG